MENKRVVMLVTMMIVMAMGNLVIQTEAQASPSPFGKCYPCCLVNCVIEKKLPTGLTCPFTCLVTCIAPPTITPSPMMTLANEIDHTDYFCKLGCATQHCASLSSIQNPNADKVADCVDSCSNKCSNKN
ncbi:unnamed protein product [Microthlaspi erraticum]|uniref:Thionin-like protein 2 n=1 Tax=Microthlaspi erraticum TaxID=1685480 RepID=A0A6D2JHH2_9BRAS|nr:unnamed protein product [Microthlaspi erraticum]